MSKTEEKKESSQFIDLDQSYILHGKIYKKGRVRVKDDEMREKLQAKMDANRSARQNGNRLTRKDKSVTGVTADSLDTRMPVLDQQAPHVEDDRAEAREAAEEEARQAEEGGERPKKKKGKKGKKNREETPE
jgi:hypothetical protein